MPILHVDLICRSSASETDGIRDHTLRLCQALEDRPGVTARAHDLRSVPEDRDLAALLVASQRATLGAHHVVLVQYNPYSFDRRGVPWWLPQAIKDLKLARPQCTVVLLVHELWLRLDSAAHALIGVPQRVVFGVLRSACDLVAVSTESFAARTRLLGNGPVRLLPVGSNLPDRRRERLSKRTSLGIRTDQLVVAAFGTRHPSRLFAHLKRAMEAIVAARPDVVLLNLGASAPPLEGNTATARMLTPGLIAEADLACYLATVDLLLLPFADGVATRRTTVMAGLQHAVPILGTDGANTSLELRSSGSIALVAADASPDLYAKRACELLADEAERRRFGQAGRALYEERFSWPVIASQLVTMIVETGAS